MTNPLKALWNFFDALTPFFVALVLINALIVKVFHKPELSWIALAIAVVISIEPLVTYIKGLRRPHTDDTAATPTTHSAQS
ncbi:hypothetical protein C1Y63_11285 [Corynebacterium sp. 13CS0277]|uniref:hypothetical protein n=1 Tax=Corynebacterium sp. 13CS0277 TaxID=2071994 RepID=UPI000D03DA4F|nr:hypothetical protein [Corynebacterium sp. 13CS0277]PRQ10466.1 hypothetical protein C1Y63_11285 [Corynebacterium sp. 13CS0277]